MGDLYEEPHGVDEGGQEGQKTENGVATEDDGSWCHKPRGGSRLPRNMFPPHQKGCGLHRMMLMKMPPLCGRVHPNALTSSILPYRTYGASPLLLRLDCPCLLKPESSAWTLAFRR